MLPQDLGSNNVVYSIKRITKPIAASLKHYLRVKLILCTVHTFFVFYFIVIIMTWVFEKNKLKMYLSL